MAKQDICLLTSINEILVDDSCLEAFRVVHGHFVMATFLVQFTEPSCLMDILG